jgi:hypothetical protein
VSKMRIWIAAGVVLAFLVVVGALWARGTASRVRRELLSTTEQMLTDVSAGWDYDALVKYADPGFFKSRAPDEVREVCRQLMAEYGGRRAHRLMSWNVQATTNDGTRADVVYDVELEKSRAVVTLVLKPVNSSWKLFSLGVEPYVKPPGPAK